MKHEPKTPLPWEYSTVKPLDEDDVDYAIHAANSYPKLVAALKAIAADPDIMSVHRCMAVAEVVLKEVGEL